MVCLLKLNWMVLLALILSASIAGAKTLADPEDFVKSLLEKYSESSYFVVDKADNSPRSFQFKDGTEMNFTTFSQLKDYIKSSQAEDVLSEVNTAVHETAHEYTSKVGYQLLLKQGVEHIGRNFYQAYYPGNSREFVVKITKCFPAAELNTVVDDDLQTERFASYVYPSRKDLGTQINGVYGLLDEFHAYYHGTKAVFDLYPYFEKEQDWALYFRNFYATYFAYQEFKYFILKYLVFAGQKHPEMYQKILENKEFRECFLLTEGAFAKLIRDFDVRKQQILKGLKKKGVSIRETDEAFVLDGKTILTFHEIYDAFDQELQKNEYKLMMKTLADTRKLVQSTENTKEVTIRFDAASFVESFGSVQSVHIAGSFNDFDSTDSRYALLPVSGEGHYYSITLRLKPGKYLYNLNIDGMNISDMSETASLITPEPVQFEKDTEGNVSAVLVVQ